MEISNGDRWRRSKFDDAETERMTYDRDKQKIGSQNDLTNPKASDISTANLAT